MKKTALGKYFQLVLKLNFLSEESNGSLEKIRLIIEEFIKHDKDQEHQAFFQAELAFLEKDYKKALKYYFLSRHIPDITFFCNRCNALIYFESNKYKEALSSLKKALLEKKEDLTCLQLLLQIKTNLDSHKEKLPQAQENDNLKELEEGLVSLKSLKEDNFLERFQQKQQEDQELIIDTPEKLFLDPQEMEDLETLFSGNASEGNPNKTEYDKLEEELELEDYFQGTQSWKVSSESTLEFESDESHLPLISHDTPESLIDFDSYSWDSLSESVPSFSFDSSGEDLVTDPSRSVIQALNFFKKGQQAYWEHYQKVHPSKTDYFLMTFDDQNDPKNALTAQELSWKNLAIQEQTTHEGLYFKWGKQGGVFNPSKGFLEKFHNRGLSLFDLHFIILSHLSPSIKEELSHLAFLRENLQKYSGQAVPCFTLFYLEDTPGIEDLPDCFECIQSINYKKSPTRSETLKLNDSLSLQAFNPHFSNKLHPPPLVEGAERPYIAFKLIFSTATGTQNLAFIPHTQWSPSFIEHFSDSKLIISDFNTLSDKDYNLESLEANGTGFHGLYKLLGQFPKATHITYHLNAKHLPLKAAIINELKQKVKNKTGSLLDLFPSCSQLKINLQNFYLFASDTHSYLPAQKVRLHFSHFIPNSFSFLSKDSLL